MNHTMKNFDPSALRSYFKNNSEKDYILIDVRQPGEYEGGHIPGATLFPLPELEAKLFDLPENRDLIFYCHSGGRSMAAAMLAVEAEVSQKNVYNLSGGMMGWDGQKLTDYPKIQIFDNAQNTNSMLYKAMELEKGALRFYLHLIEKVEGAELTDVFKKMADAELGHAKRIYNLWRPHEKEALEFESLFDSLKGEILEGGQTIAQAFRYLDNIQDSFCMNCIELALYIEYSAYDLYRTLAETNTDKQAKNVFFSIAQAEKNHIQILSKAVVLCE